LRVRPAKSAQKYASIWTDEGSPLKVWSQRQADALHQKWNNRGVQVRLMMRYGSPAVAKVLDELKHEGVDRVLVIPAYPQYSATTTASVFDAVYTWALRTRRVPELRFVRLCALAAYPSCALSTITMTTLAILPRLPTAFNATGRLTVATNCW